MAQHKFQHAGELGDVCEVCGLTVGDRIDPVTAFIEDCSGRREVDPTKPSSKIGDE
jgi:hypothetical protein